jgi:hypothetical protein
VNVEQWAAGAWKMRCEVEHHAHRRFSRLSAELEHFDSGSPLIKVLSDASLEEATHARLCSERAVALGASPVDPPAATASVAPQSLPRRDRLLYELVAASCVAETESMATLTLLLSKMPRGPFRDAVHTITMDEVQHAQVGWGQLAREVARRELGFLANHLVAMLDVPPVHELFRPAAQPCAESEELWAFGVVPHTTKRVVFLAALDELVLPGLAGAGIDTGPLRAWVARLG